LALYKREIIRERKPREEVITTNRTRGEWERGREEEYRGGRGAPRDQHSLSVQQNQV
jgi:hypothetical protein